MEHKDLLRKKSPAIQNSDIDLQLKVKERDAKVRELEAACRKQEQVIEQLEKLLERKNSGKELLLETLTALDRKCHLVT